MAGERATGDSVPAKQAGKDPEAQGMSSGRQMLTHAARVLVGEGSGDDDVEVRRRAVLTLIVCYTGFGLALVFAPLAMLQGKWTLGIVELGLAVVLGGVAAYIRLVGYHPAPNYLAGAGSAALFLYLLITGGAGGSGHIWALTFPLFALFIWGANKGAMASLALLSAIVTFFVFQEQLSVAATIPWAFQARFLAGYGLVLSFTFFFERTRAASQGQLAAKNVDLERKVAELKVTDEARRESETLLKATLESTGDGILVVSTAGKVIATNDDFAAMWRMPDEVLASGEDDQLIAHVLDQLVDPGEFTTRIEELYETGEALANDTLRFKDDRVFERRSAPLVVDGGIVGRVWSFRDTSDKARAEREQGRLQAALQRSQKMEALGTLAAGVAHDLNNVLAAVVGYPDLLLRKVPDHSPLRNDLLTIRASGTKAALIVQDLLTLARRGVPNRSILNLNSVVESYLDSPEHRDLLSFHPAVVVDSSLADNLLNISGSAIHLNNHPKPHRAHLRALLHQETDGTERLGPRPGGDLERGQGPRRLHRRAQLGERGHGLHALLPSHAAGRRARADVLEEDVPRQGRVDPRDR
ncbi:MAG: PAS domain-containing protein [Deltaproteobacteria bacterium]|nr:PAS domain-containing protein [Deltaproteobacteria bacterium]